MSKLLDALALMYIIIFTLITAVSCIYILMVQPTTAALIGVSAVFLLFCSLKRVFS